MNLRTVALRARYSIAAALLLASCRSSTEPLHPDLELGSYALESIDGRAVPTGVPCGVWRVLEGSIALKENRTATLFFRYASLGSEEEITYSGTGTFRMGGDYVLLTVLGGWSHQSAQSEWQLGFEIEPGVLRRRFVGAECDASSTEVYRM